MKQKVKDREHLYRDSKSKAIINKDKQGFLAAKQAKKAITDRDSRLKTLEEKLAELEAKFEEALNK